MTEYLKFFDDRTIKKAMAECAKISGVPPERQKVIFEFKLLRISKGFSMQDLEIASGTPQGHVSRFEKGAMNVTLETLGKWTTILGVEISLITESGAVPNSYEAMMNSRNEEIKALKVDLGYAEDLLLEVFQEQTKNSGELFDHRNNKTLRRLQRALIAMNKLTAEQCVKI